MDSVQESILLTGGSGRLGSELREVAERVFSALLEP